MPLHLLGKKSWNVYNHDNIERVERDEAEAAAKEAAEEQRMQEVDSERRLRILRGLPVDDLEDEHAKPPEHESKPIARTYGERDRKRRKIGGEDDTDRDIRYAKEAQSIGQENTERRSHKASRDVPLHDGNGHINLFPEEKKHKTRDAPGNPDVEAERARKERQLEDQYTMRFANAGGFKQTVDKKPWFQVDSVANGNEQERSSKNVWGEEDPNRRKREEVRMAADDPLAAIQRGVKGVRQAESDRNQWKERRRREIDEMVREEKRAARRSRHRDVDELEGFSLDADPVSDQKRSKHREHRHHRHRSKSPRQHRRHHPHKRDRDE